LKNILGHRPRSRKSIKQPNRSSGLCCPENSPDDENNETLSLVAMRVSNEDCSPEEANG
jgi:hypothetical protein